MFANPQNFQKRPSTAKKNPSKRQKVQRQNASLPMGAMTFKAGNAPEKKNIDTVSTATITFNQTTANLLLLNATNQGVGASQRLGRRFMMKSIFIRWNATLAATTTGSSSLRCLIVYDKEPKGAALTAVSVLTADVIYSLMNLDNSRRFSILMDEVISVMGTQGPQSFNVNRYRKLNHQVETLDANNGTIADIQTGSVYALFWQDGGLLVASPNNGFACRIRYIDV